MHLNSISLWYRNHIRTVNSAISVPKFPFEQLVTDSHTFFRMPFFSNVDALSNYESYDHERSTERKANWTASECYRTRDSPLHVARRLLTKNGWISPKTGFSQQLCAWACDYSLRAKSSEESADHRLSLCDADCCGFSAESAENTCCDKHTL